MLTNKPAYLLFTVYMSDGGDHKDYKSLDTNFLNAEDLDDLKKVQQDHDIKQWTYEDPATWESWPPGTAAIVQYRGIHIKPIKIIEQWGYTHDKQGDF